MAPDGDAPSRAAEPGILRTEELMIGVQERALESARGGGDDELALTPLFNRVRELLDSDRLLASRVLGDRSEWDLATHLRFESHRPLLGRLLIAFKRHLLLPPLRWLYEYSWQNFVRQRAVNRALFAYVELLARENARLRLDLESRTAGGGARGRPETPGS